ncbi:MAG: hypothetical protein WAM77_02535, partial [Xanthobacteraceae bacterium]
MTTTTDAPRAAQSHAGGPRVYRWQTPAVILVCGCLIAMLNFGPRSAVGQFLNPMSVELHWGRDVFSF